MTIELRSQLWQPYEPRSRLPLPGRHDADPRCKWRQVKLLLLYRAVPGEMPGWRVTRLSACLSHCPEYRSSTESFIASRPGSSSDRWGGPLSPGQSRQTTICPQHPRPLPCCGECRYCGTSLDVKNFWSPWCFSTSCSLNLPWPNVDEMLRTSWRRVAGSEFLRYQTLTCWHWIIMLDLSWSWPEGYQLNPTHKTNTCCGIHGYQDTL